MPPRKRHLEQPSITQRPRTRAFVRAEANQEKQRTVHETPKPKDLVTNKHREVEENVTRGTRAGRVTRQSKVTKSEHNSRRGLKQDAPKPAPKRRPKKPKLTRKIIADNPKIDATIINIEEKITAKTKRRVEPILAIDQTSGLCNQTESVSNWLRRVYPTHPESTGRNQPSSKLSEADSDSSNLGDSMTSSQQRQPSEIPSSNGQSKVREGKITVGKLKARYIRLTAEGEEKEWRESHQYLKEAALPTITKGQISKIEKAVQEFEGQFERRRPEDIRQLVEALRYNLDAALSLIDHPVPPEIYFNSMIEKCKTNNEAVLQRSVMVNVFHHHWLGKRFDWNAEGTWLKNDFTRIPTIKDDPKNKISLPRPDLVVGFRLQSFEEDIGEFYEISSQLESAMKPDGGEERCFPFLIMEVKRSADSLQTAMLKNLHTASQALHNMHLWNVEAGGATDFYEKVRVFTFVFNAGELGVRVHRIKPLGTGQPVFMFDELHPLSPYTRDSVCQMVNAILYEYALNELLPVLRAAFKKVTAPGLQLPATLPSIIEDDEAGSSEAEDLERNSISKRHKSHDPKRRLPETDGPKRPKRAKKSKEPNHTGVSGNFEQTIIDSQ